MVKKLISLIISLINLLIVIKVDCTPQILEPSPKSPENLSNTNPIHPILSEGEIYQKAQSITVKIFSGNTSGSGILIHQQGQIYTVVTNHHVLIFGTQNQSYKIKTPDGQIYTSELVNTINFKNYDLGLLQFRSSKHYLIASLSRSVKFNEGQEVFAAGFPFESDKLPPNELVLTKGNIAMLSVQAFGGGYQIGSTNSIKKGMSGGPLLNRWGEVVGINGVHKYPLWGNYMFENGSLASSEQKEQMRQLSWAIPVQTLLNFVPQFASTRS